MPFLTSRSPTDEVHVLHPEAVSQSSSTVQQDNNEERPSTSFLLSSSSPLPFLSHSLTSVSEIIIHRHFLSPSIPVWSFLIFHPMEGNPLLGEDVEMMDHSNGKYTVTDEASPMVEPFIGMEFESEEAAKSFYDSYATGRGFVMRVDAFRRSMRDRTVVWRRLVCNKEGFRRLIPRRSESRKPRAITREGCKALIVVKKEKSGKWIVTKFVKEHNHPLLPNGRRSSQLSQTPDEKDAKIRELTTQLSRERRRCAALQQQLDMTLKEMEEHSNHLSINIDNVIQSVREIESNTLTKKPLAE